MLLLNNKMELINFDTCRSVVDRGANMLEKTQEDIAKELANLLSGFKKTCESFSQKGKIENLPIFLEEIDKLQSELKRMKETYDKKIKEQAKKLGQEIEVGLQPSSERGIRYSDLSQKGNFQTPEGKHRIEQALAFMGNSVCSSIREKLKNLEYRNDSVDIGGVTWSLSGKGRYATRQDFERSFRQLFGCDLPPLQKNNNGELEYPWDPRIAIIPMVLGLEKKGRYGKDNKWHNKGISGFYELGGGRVLKFDHTGGTVRKKRDSDGKFPYLYIAK